MSAQTTESGATTERKTSTFNGSSEISEQTTANTSTPVGGVVTTQRPTEPQTMPQTDSTSGEDVTERPSKTTRISTHHESPFPTSRQTMYSSLSDQTDHHSTSMHPTTSEPTQYVWMINNQIYDYSTIEVYQFFFFHR